MTKLNETRSHDYREILRIAIPLGLANLMLVGNSVVDLLMIGSLGIQEMAGAILSIQLYLLLVVFGEGVVSAFTPLFSASRGKNNMAEQGRTLLGTIIMSLIFFAVAAVIMYYSSWLLSAVGVERELTDLAKSYGQVVAFSILPALISVIIWEIASIHGKSTWVTVSSIIGFLANIVLNWIFILSGWGLPGIALATLLSNCIVIACILVIMMPTIRELLPYMTRLSEAFAMMPRLIRLGLPIGGIELATVGFFASTTYLMSFEPSEIIAAHAIAYQVTEFAIVLVLGFGEAATILVANAFGAENWPKLRRISVAITGACLAVALVVCGIMVALSPWLPSLFVPGEDDVRATISMATTFILIGATFTLLDALQIAWLGVLRGIQDTMVPMIIVMIGYWVIGVPAGYVLAHKLDIGPTGIWWGLTIGLAFVCFGLALRIWRNMAAIRSRSINMASRSSKLINRELR
ncbi:MATE family efflux transporter [Halomonas sp. BC04]|uniref:MATE family efflux transporter n=1 Tax=Halomonas sp. BC04 TaxID=1403540 RepID=UPI0003ED669B|nr:MATE family efflux transporter [Halomonas sp. BC04]EWH00417.1 hypothetical protein Q427_19630 [Halomonas sp. BC04]